MGADEEGTLGTLKAHRRELVDPKIAEHRGRIVKTTGDGILIEFSSAVDAARCALDVQRGMVERNANIPPDRRIEFRIGINVGDIIFEGGDIFGDGVNIAARLENIAEPNGIVVSEDTYRQVRDKFDVPFEDGGEQQLKNIARPVRVYRMQTGRSIRSASPSLRAQITAGKPNSVTMPFGLLTADALRRADRPAVP
jgi:adenylate cyclase